MRIGDSSRTESPAAIRGQHLVTFAYRLDRFLRSVGHRHERSGHQALVRVADCTEVPVLARKQLQQPVLRVVRVLVLVDEHVAERLLPALARLGEALQHVDGEHQQVVEVDRVRAEEPPLVQLVHLGDRLVEERRHALAVHRRRDELVLRVRDRRVDAARDETLRVALQLLEARLHEPHLVGLVVDREVRSVAEPRRLRAQDAAARGVEGHDPDRPRLVAEQVVQARAHLRGGLVRERDREDLVRLHAARADQVRDAVREHARLPGAGARDDEQRPFRREHGLALGVVQLRQVLVRSRDRHAVDASGEVRQPWRSARMRPSAA